MNFFDVNGIEFEGSGDGWLEGGSFGKWPEPEHIQVFLPEVGPGGFPFLTRLGSFEETATQFRGFADEMPVDDGISGRRRG